MLTLTLNRKAITVPSLEEAYKVFCEKAPRRASQFRANDGLVSVDGKPRYIFSPNGRLWAAIPRDDFEAFTDFGSKVEYDLKGNRI